MAPTQSSPLREFGTISAFLIACRREARRRQRRRMIFRVSLLAAVSVAVLALGWL